MCRLNELLETIFLFPSESGDEKEFYLITKNGVPTWLESKESVKPFFLNLYSPVTFKGVFFSFFCKMIWFFNVQKVFFKKIKVKVAPGSVVNEVQKISSFFSVFLGTPGVNRKVVFCLLVDGRRFYFKLPISNDSKFLVDNELSALNFLNNNCDFYGCIPAVKKYGDLQLMSSQQTSVNNVSPVLTDLHLSFIGELIKEKSNIAVTEYYSRRNFYRDLDALKVINIKNSKLKMLVSHGLVSLERSLNGFVQDKIFVSLSHGDFSPWNCSLNDNSIFVFDWELFDMEAPIYFDVIHYVISTAILVEKSNCNEIKTKLSDLKCLLMCSKDVDYVDLENWWIYVKLYVINISFYYMGKYIKQDEEVHEQVYWQLDMWRKILDEKL